MTIERDTPLRRHTPLKRSGPPRRSPKQRKPSSNAPRSRSDFSPRVKRRALNATNGVCAQCGEREIHYHHRKMRSAGGPGTFENCLPLCLECHREVHDHPDWAYRHGLLVRSHGNPKHVGVFTGCGVSCPANHISDGQ